MAINYKGTELGYMIVKCNGKNERVSLRKSNCLAFWLYVYQENGKWYHSIYDVWLDEQCIKRLDKNGYPILREQDGIVEIGLNLYFKECKKILDIIIKHNYEVKVFYKIQEEIE